MMALHSKLKNNLEGIKGGASVDIIGTVWEDVEAMKNKERSIVRTIQLEDDFASS
jgi:hypothetical protein